MLIIIHVADFLFLSFKFVSRKYQFLSQQGNNLQNQMMDRQEESNINVEIYSDKFLCQCSITMSKMIFVSNY